MTVLCDLSKAINIQTLCLIMHITDIHEMIDVETDNNVFIRLIT